MSKSSTVLSTFTPSFKGNKSLSLSSCLYPLLNNLEKFVKKRSSIRVIFLCFFDESSFFFFFFFERSLNFFISIFVLRFFWLLLLWEGVLDALFLFLFFFLFFFLRMVEIYSVFSLVLISELSLICLEPISFLRV